MIKVMSAVEIINQIETSDSSFFIEKIIPAGITILVGKPKSGKSLLALQLSNAIANGLNVFGCKSKKSTVLYISTELRKEDIKERLFKSGALINDDLRFANAHRLDFEELENCLLKNKKKMHDFVVIDILEKLIAFDSINDYKAIYSLLDKFAYYYTNYNISFLLVHHLNKSEKTLGSTGFEAACDTILTLLIDKETNCGKLKVITRKCTDEIYNLQFRKEQLIFELMKEKREIEKIDMAIALIIKFIISTKEFKGNLQDLAVQSNVISLNLNPLTLGKLLRANNDLLDKNGIIVKKKKSNVMQYEITYDSNKVHILGEWESDNGQGE